MKAIFLCFRLTGLFVYTVGSDFAELFLSRGDFNVGSEVNNTSPTSVFGYFADTDIVSAACYRDKGDVCAPCTASDP